MAYLLIYVYIISLEGVVCVRVVFLKLVCL